MYARALQPHRPRLGGFDGRCWSSFSVTSPDALLHASASRTSVLRMPITASEGSVGFANARADLDDLIKRRFFFRQAFEIYGGVGGFYTYGPPGAAVKQNLIALWRNHFVIEENLLEVDDTCIMPHEVLLTSGHVERFNDFIVKDAKVRERMGSTHRGGPRLTARLSPSRSRPSTCPICWCCACASAYSPRSSAARSRATLGSRPQDPKIFFRADKLLEDVMDARMAEKGVTEDLKTELTKVKNQADAYSKDELWAVFQKYQIKSPETKNDLTEPQEFNLMFPTPIGPLGGKGGYLRPETAQGIFLNFKFCLEQNAGNMPFGVAQVCGHAAPHEHGAPLAHGDRGSTT